MSEPLLGPGPRPAAPFPSPFGIVDAFGLVRNGAGQVGAWAVYLPVVGIVLGALWLATDTLVNAVAGRFGASLAVLCVSAAATRARPTVALSRMLAALASRRADRLAVLESGGGQATAAALVLVLAAQLTVLCWLDRFRVVGLAFAPLLGCCGMVVIAVGSRAARTDGRRLKFAPAVTFREFGVASTATFALIFLTTEFLGLLLVLATAASTIAARVFLHRWIDGVNETALLASGEATQLVILILLAAL
jgi:cobalamin synthase